MHVSPVTEARSSVSQAFLLTQRSRFISGVSPPPTLPPKYFYIFCNRITEMSSAVLLVIRITPAGIWDVTPSSLAGYERFASSCYQHFSVKEF